MNHLILKKIKSLTICKMNYDGDDDLQDKNRTTADIGKRESKRRSFDHPLKDPSFSFCNVL